MLVFKLFFIKVLNEQNHIDVWTSMPKSFVDFVHQIHSHVLPEGQKQKTCTDTDTLQLQKPFNLIFQLSWHSSMFTIKALLLWILCTNGFAALYSSNSDSPTPKIWWGGTWIPLWTIWLRAYQLAHAIVT